MQEATMNTARFMPGMTVYRGLQRVAFGAYLKIFLLNTQLISNGCLRKILPLLKTISSDSVFVYGGMYNNGTILDSVEKLLRAKYKWQILLTPVVCI
jgi:hypothetical protein